MRYTQNQLYTNRFRDQKVLPRDFTLYSLSFSNHTAPLRGYPTTQFYSIMRSLSHKCSQKAYIDYNQIWNFWKAQMFGFCQLQSVDDPRHKTFSWSFPDQSKCQLLGQLWPIGSSASCPKKRTAAAAAPAAAGEGKSTEKCIMLR